MQNKIKKILSVFLATLMILSIVPVTQLMPTAKAATREYFFPVKNGKLAYLYGTTSSYGIDDFHYGIDIHYTDDTTIYAAYGGEVESVGWSSSTAGYRVCIKQDDGLYAIYCHLAGDSGRVTEGQRVEMGTPIATIGNTGGKWAVHLHFEVSASKYCSTSNSINVNPVSYENAQLLNPKESAYYGDCNNSTAKYGTVKYRTSLHECSYGSNYLCKTCNAVNPSKITTMSDTAYIVVSDNPICRIAPYNTFNDNTVRVKKDDIVTVTGKMTNASNSLWYRLSNGKWIYSEHIKPYTVTYTDIADGCYRLKNVYTQKYLIVDSGDGSNKKNVSVWPLVESATEEKWNLTEDSLGFRIHTALSSGRVLNPYGTTVNAGNNVNIYDLIANDTTQRWKFQKVSGGYVVRNVSNPSCVLTIENGYNACVKNFVSGDTTQIWIIEPVTGCSHTYNSGTITKKATCTTTGVKIYTCTKCGTTKTETISATGHNFGSGTVTKKATCTEAGVKTYTCTRCSTTKTETISATGHNFGSWVVTKNATCTSTGTEQKTCSGCGKHETRSIEKTKHNYKSKTIAPTCTDYEKIQYVCEICNHTYYKYSEDNYSIWSETKPTGVDETLIESKTQYRYSDYETKTSYETSLSGYTKISNSWEKTNTGSVQYVKNWPSGFSTSNSQYSAYNKSAKSAYENTTNKLVVTGEQISGYLYYHWCRGTYTSGPKNRKSTAEYTSECNAFHAFFSTTAPNGLSAAGDGSYQYSNGSCCKDSYWYFYIPVYTQTYSEYKNLFTYERWTNWSDWKDTAYTSSSTRKVETRTVYRYLNSQLGSHVYDNDCDSKCNSCGETRNITHAYTSASCTVPATCTICGTTNGDSLGHTFTDLCDATCNRCGETRFTTHIYETTTTKATLTKNGSSKTVCSDCGYVKSTKTISYPKTFTLSTTSYTYNDKVKTPTVTVKDANGKVLTKGTDYTVTYASGRKNIGTYNVTVKMIGNYTGTKTLSFKIKPIDISTCKVKLSSTSYTYNGKVKTPTVTVTNSSGTVLTEGKSYTVTYASGRKNAGTYNVTVKMIGNYTGTKTLSFKIKPIDISTCKVKLSATSYTYNGKVKTPTVTVTNASGTKLTKGTSYTVTYAAGRKNAGTYKVTVKMMGNYTGTKTLSFKIKPIDISTCKVKLSATSYTYNGKVKTPIVTVTNASGTKLTKDKSYTVTYASGRKNAGTYKVTVTMKGNYTGTKILTFKINPIKISTCTVKLSATSLTYNGNVRTPTVTVTNSYGTKLTKDKHYTVTYASGRKSVGTYKVTIKMIGNYTGTKTLTFKINPPKTTVASLKAGTKSITVNLTKKTTQVTGYQIQYSTNKDFTNAKTKTITSNSTVKTTLSGLTAAKTYYVRVRTYKTVNDVKYYSGWSQYKYVKTK